MEKDRDLLRPVFTLRTLPELIQGGANIHLECVEEPYKVLSNWKGNWRVYAVEKPDERKILVSYNSVNPKDHKSTNALFSLFRTIGLQRYVIPPHLGDVEVFTRDDFDLSKFEETTK